MQKIIRLLKFITAAATLLLVIYLGWSCIDVYLVGNSASNIADGGVHIAPVFTREIAAERLSSLLPWVLGYAVLVAVTSAMQTAAKEQGAASGKGRPYAAKPTEYKKMEELKIPVSVLRLCLAVAAVLLVLLGVANGGAGDVLIKAVNICTECIGLG